jgi:hypothetical protein
LGKSRKGVVFAHDADHRLPFPPGGGECGGDSADVVLDAESGFLELGFQEVGAFHFFVADLGEFPDLARDLAPAVALGIHGLQDVRAVIGERGKGEKQNGNGSHGNILVE